jgi:hypothetical protein
VTGQHNGPIGELSVLETHAKAFLVGVFGIPPAAVLVALEGAGVTLPTWATALLALLPIIAAGAGVVVGPANTPAPVLVLPPIDPGPPPPPEPIPVNPPHFP